MQTAPTKTPPGELVKIQFPVTVSLLLVLAVVTLTGLWIECPTWRNGINFFGVASGIAAGLLSAFYVGKALQVTIHQRDKSLTDDKISRAFALAIRWNEPNMAPLRREWRALLEEIEQRNGDQVCDVVKSDIKKRTVVSDVLNFFEEMAYAAKSEVADVETLREIFGSIAVRYFNQISPWIHRYRTDKNQSSAYIHFEWLYNKWR
jgi:hypothetical protein